MHFTVDLPGKESIVIWTNRVKVILFIYSTSPYCDL